MDMYKHTYLSRFATPHQNYTHPPEGTVFVPQYGDVKPHCGHTLMLMLLEEYYNMQELRFLCRGFNRALLHLGFELDESDLTPKQSVNELVSGDIESMFHRMTIGGFDPQAKAFVNDSEDSDWDMEQSLGA